MNLHNIVAGAVDAVVARVPVVISVSTGYQTLQDFSRIPTYNNVQTVARFEAMSGGDLRQTENLNLNGVLRAIYFEGDVEATIRTAIKGGDVVTDSDGNEWLVKQVLETWPGWCKVAAVLQTKPVAS